MEKKEIKTAEDLKNIQADLKGHEIIKFIAKTLPNQPGVYQMEDDEGNILYIGKAKNLSKRVINYTNLKLITLFERFLAFPIYNIFSSSSSI